MTCTCTDTKQCDFCAQSDKDDNDWAPGEWEAEVRAQMIADGNVAQDDSPDLHQRLLAEAKALDDAYAKDAALDEAYNHDLLALVQAARIVVSAMSTGAKFIPLVDFQRVKDGLKTALEQFEPWLEERTDDPRTNGWVDDKGRP